MPPAIAVLLTISFCGLMLWRDVRREPRMSFALWLPVIWLFILGSQFVSQWLGLFGIDAGGATLEDGSPLDALFFLVLMLAGVVVLARRGVSVRSLVTNNIWVTVFLVYCLLAITWSDFPIAATRKWVKILGHPIMALIVLTEADRTEALGRVIRRCAYLHFPLSILFIKYLPQGRGFDQWSGAPTNHGINLNKNELGYTCLVFGLFLFWNLFYGRRGEGVRPPKVDKMRPDWNDRLTRVAFLVMCGWLLLKSDSATSLVCGVLGASVMVLAGFSAVSRRYLGTYVIVTVVALVITEFTFGVYAHTLQFLGRDSTLTDRTILWGDLFAMDVNPFIGAGFESFWLGPRREALWSKWWWRPNQAHNGYIETYLNLGYIGLAILFCMLIATFRKSQIELGRNLDFGRVRLGVLAAVIVYNHTEATFKAVHLVWTAFYLVAIDYPLARHAQQGDADSGHNSVSVRRRPGWRRAQDAPRSHPSFARPNRAAVQKHLAARGTGCK